MKTQKNEEQPNSGNDNNHETKRICFVIMPISDTDNYLPGHFQRVYEFIIKPACRMADFEPVRADDIKSTNVIIIDILNKILDSDMAVCDLSSKNPNVLYELGIRQAFDKPVTLIKDELTDRIFDTNMLRDVPYHSQMRFDQVGKAVADLAEAMTETYNNRESEGNSMVSLLGRARAKIKPTEISHDTKILLEAITDSNRRVEHTIDNQQLFSTVPVGNIVLPSGQTVKIGERVIHKTFGRGILQKILLNISLTSSTSDDWEDGMLTIKFDRFGIKAVSLKQEGRLLKIDDSDEDEYPFA